jgi:predicted nuclease of predicted toxin-antitoxin system
MLLLFDENVPRDLASHYQTAGHSVLMVGIDLAKTVSDNEIILFARSRDAIILTWNHKHFMPRALRERQPGREHLRTWGLITYHVPEPGAIARTQDLLETIEFEFQQCAARRPACLILTMEIWPTFFRVYR